MLRSLVALKSHNAYTVQRELFADVIGQERVIRTPENRDFTSNVLDLIQGQEAVRLTNAVSRLTILSMIFLPLTFLVGLFELNFITTDPGLVIPISGARMLLVILGMTTLSGGMMSWFFRRKGWL